MAIVSCMNIPSLNIDRPHVTIFMTFYILNMYFFMDYLSFSQLYYNGNSLIVNTVFIIREAQ